MDNPLNTLHLFGVRTIVHDALMEIPIPNVAEDGSKYAELIHFLLGHLLGERQRQSCYVGFGEGKKKNKGPSYMCTYLLGLPALIEGLRHPWTISPVLPVGGQLCTTEPLFLLTKAALSLSHSWQTRICLQYEVWQSFAPRQYCL